MVYMNKQPNFEVYPKSRMLGGGVFFMKDTFECILECVEGCKQAIAESIDSRKSKRIEG